MKTRPAAQTKSIWGTFASELRQDLAEGEEPLVAATADADCSEPSDISLTATAEGDEPATLSPKSDFIEKWAAKRAEKPKAGAADIVAPFLMRIERQKALLAEFETDPAGFASWRSAWFRKVAGGFGISIGHDLIDAGGGLRYLVVDTLRDVCEFLDDLAHHAQTDSEFQRALSENRLVRSSRRLGV
ncbi:hypothetical protein GA0061102_10552 [Rhizobium miluonense]|uniref:Uncharacterized protein n=1 Tax=Rhizobium miluonense TaxID=411945 RepID=A0A1C3X3D2_9HYPH|nr:hypothetical protein GA0061102_10552 [Rhizobium miluonense]